MMLENLMSTGLVTMQIDDTLDKAKAIFSEHKIHHILVLDDTELMGVINDRDLYQNLSPNIGTSKETHKDISYLQKKVHLVMNRNLVTAPSTMSIKEAVLLFHDNHISCLPVVDEKFRAIGIITWRDIIKVIALQYRRSINIQN